LVGDPLEEPLFDLAGQVSETVVTLVATKSWVFALGLLEPWDDSPLVPVFAVVLLLLEEVFALELLLPEPLLGLLPRLEPGAPAVPCART
jgi:hypothetical protein